MGVSTLGGFAVKMHVLAKETVAADRVAVRAAATLVQKTQMDLIGVETKGTFRLQGVGSKRRDKVNGGASFFTTNKSLGSGAGARIGITVSVIGDTNPTALLSAVGPLHLLERSTKMHDVSTRLSRGRGKRLRGGQKSNLPKALHWGGSPGHFAQTTHGHHSTGKHPFWTGAAMAEPYVMQAFARAHAAALIKAVG